MQPKMLVCAIAASAVFFIAGLAVGQRTSSSKFDKYLRPANFVEMDFIALQVDVDSIRGQMPMRDDISEKIHGTERQSPGNRASGHLSAH